MPLTTTPETLDMRQNGFTLAELMVGLAVAGITLTVGVPSMSRFIANQGQVAAGNELVTAMMLARSEAIKQNRFVTVCHSADGQQCSAGEDWHNGWIVFANTSQANADTVDANEQVIRYFNRRGDPRTVSADTAGLNFVSFSPTGTVPTAVTWVLCDRRGEDEARGVALNRAGRARVAPLPAAESEGGAVGAACS